MALPSKQYLDAIRADRGKPKVTYPYGGTGFPRIERAYAVPKGRVSSIPATLPDFAGSALVELHELARDDVNVEVYLRYDTLPGPALTTTRLDEAGDTVTVTRQHVALANVVTSEAITDGVWIRKYKGGGDTVTAEQITESQALPGTSITTSRFDTESDTVITEVRTKKAAASITPGSNTPGTSAIVTELSPITALVAHEIVTTYPDSPHNDLATARIEYESKPYQFPTRVDVNNFDLVAGVPVGLRKPVVDGVLFTTKIYWTLSTSEPNLVLDSISYGDTIRFPNGFSFGDCIHDAATIVYPGLGSVNFPATTPSYTDFTSGVGQWIGTDRVVQARARPDKHRYRWRVEITTVVMQ